MPLNRVVRDSHASNFCKMLGHTERPDGVACHNVLSHTSRWIFSAVVIHVVGSLGLL
jgi:hypothetical protein